jgi:transcriptional regulator of heat shock response
MAIEQQRVYSSGYAHILSFPEFANIDVARTVLTLVEEVRAMQEIFAYGQGDEPVHLVLGEDLGNQYLASVGFVFAGFQVGNRAYDLGIVGPARLDYAYVLPIIKYSRQLVLELLG